MPRPLKKLMKLAVLVVLLGGCYLPGSFDAAIEISRTGLYKLSYDGYIIDLNLYRDITEKKLPAKEIKPKIDIVLNDFKRDKGTKLIRYFDKGAFQVKWSKGGDLVRARQVVFFRRNENIFSITYNKDKGTMTVRGKYIKKQDANRLAQMGLDVVRGFIQVKTDGQVLEHNAHKVTDQGAVKIYGWEIKSVFDRAPKMVVLLR